MTRHKLDFYETGIHLTNALLGRYTSNDLGLTILEPCAGRGAIVQPLLKAGYRVMTNDIDPAHGADSNLDASKMEVPRHDPPDHVTSVVTNPPFNQAQAILENFLRQDVNVVMLLRLSFLEPTFGRLHLPPPKAMIVLPRYSFSEDGATDSVTCAWMLWGRFQPWIDVATEAKRVMPRRRKA